MFPPLAAFSYIFTDKEHRVENSEYENQKSTGKFSGHGAFIFYKIF